LQDNPGVRLLPRMGYRDFLMLAAGAAYVMTDGGSNQEELAALGVPTLVMRARSERSDGFGANVMMEADVPGGVEAFIATKGYEKLRRPPMPLEAEGPSQRIADARWGGAEAGSSV
jgi:UDP-N-acetylglucosamine 2-epimerase (non-hydrolysing)